MLRSHSMDPQVSLCSCLSPHRKALCAGVSEWLSGAGPGDGPAFLQEQGCSPGVCGGAAEGGAGLHLRGVCHGLAGGWHPGVSQMSRASCPSNSPGCPTSTSMGAK